MTAAEGLKALMNWVENGIEPKTVETVRVNMKGDLLANGKQDVYRVKE